MKVRPFLIVLFVSILLAMIAVTSWASSVQPLWEWTGLKQRPNHAWTIATLFDTYFSFLTFYIWVAYKEAGAVRRAVWFVAIMALGNMAVAAYMLKELFKIRPGDDMAQLLTRRNA